MGQKCLPLSRRDSTELLPMTKTYVIKTYNLLHWTSVVAMAREINVHIKVDIKLFKVVSAETKIGRQLITEGCVNTDL